MQMEAFEQKFISSTFTVNGTFYREDSLNFYFTTFTIGTLEEKIYALLGPNSFHYQMTPFWKCSLPRVANKTVRKS